MTVYNWMCVLGIPGLFAGLVGFIRLQVKANQAMREAVKAMLDTAKGRIKVKPSGGIRNYETAKMYVDMGVDRLGIGYTSCKPIVEGGTSTEAY